jgi:ABC-type multidrug transport system fused ATPase/permease subunit
MYDKVSVLSMKSLTETNSGKLITIMSSDLCSIESALSLIPELLGAPVLNLICYTIVGYNAGWIYAAICAGVWLFMLFCQWAVASRIKVCKGSEGAENDQRMKLVNDLV